MAMPLYDEELRHCQKCHSPMDEGFVRFELYYCSRKCLFSDGLTEEQWLVEHEENFDDCYWTTWYDE